MSEQGIFAQLIYLQKKKKTIGISQGPNPITSL